MGDNTRRTSERGAARAVKTSSSSAALRRRRAAIRSDIEALFDETVERLETITDDDRRDPLDERFWGPAPSPEQVRQAVVGDLHDRFLQRRALAEESFTREDAAKLLGISPQSVTSAIDAGRVVGFKDGREWRLPCWQFDADTVTGVLPELGELQRAFPGGPVSLSRWMQRPSKQLGGRVPLEEFRAGRRREVIEAAGTLTAAAW